MSELKPCPFCGSEAELIELKTGLLWYHVECKDCYSSGWYDLGKSGAIAMWNQRPLEAQLLEACKAALSWVGGQEHSWDIEPTLQAAIAAAEGDAP